MEPNKAQNKASNPYTSAWVSASAGSGKTKVLADRVLNLMLMTGKTDRILCLTFTKVAAAEMANRITDRLKKWSVLSEKELEKELENLTGEIPEKEILLDDLLQKGDTVIFVTPIDKEAPKGRLILPQVQTLRNALDNGIISVVVQVNELQNAINNLKNKPKLVVTDSQAFKEVNEILPADIPLTSFLLCL